jgi:tetratricopeptide (TPR) repeat protein
MTQRSSSADAAAHYRLGLATGRRHGPRAGLAHLRSAIDLDAGCIDYWQAYCEALAACGETATAMAILEAARQKGLSNNAMEALTTRLRLSQPTELQMAYAQAVRDHREGRLQEAIQLYRQILAQKPDLAEGHINLGSALQSQGAAEDAVAHFERAIALKPDEAEAHYNLGNALALAGRDPLPAYRAAIRVVPGHAQAHYNLGIALEKRDRTEEAIASYRAAVKAQPDLAAAHLNLGVLLHAAGDLEGAIAAYDAALVARPGFAAAHSNKGNVLQAMGALEEAAAAYGAAIAADPRFAEAHHHLGNLYRARGLLKQAAESYRAALAIEPGFAEALYSLGYVLAERGQIDEGFAALTRHAELASLRRNAGDVPRHKLRHDEEQRAHIGATAPDINGSLWLTDGARLEGPALNRGNDIAAIQRQWHVARPQLVVIDDFLGTEALNKLRRFCWSSTIWREVYGKGYLGAFPEHGVACPLLAQIAQEMRDTYPEIFMDHPLLQLWAFKYDNRLGGIPLHADFAAVNVNFWITPDEANMDKDHGGLIVWDAPAPIDWNFERYNMDAESGRKFLASQGAHSTVVPYRSNRAVVFDSDLFHETDAIDFKDGYLNRRINLTLLYGRRAAG